VTAARELVAAAGELETATAALVPVFEDDVPTVAV